MLNRRQWLKSATSSTATGVVTVARLGAGGSAIGSGAVAAGINSLGESIDSESTDYDVIFRNAVNQLTGGSFTTDEAGIRIEIPQQIYNGHYVPVAVTTGYDDVTAMHMLRNQHLHPYIASIRPTGPAYLSVTLRMARACQLWAFVLRDDGWRSHHVSISEIHAACDH